jgi:hypothetical protein
MNKIAPFLCIAILLSSCKSYFITDSSFRNEVKTQFEQRKTTLGQGHNDLFKFIGDKTIPKEQKEALKFLYTYMSLNDLADYDNDFFKQQVNTAFEAKKYFSWGKIVSEELFHHFVLPPRVNNEDMDNARLVFFDELKDRIKNMSMTEAAIEVNHWCHEKVTYRSADSRTSAPLASVRTAYGRCGEESTLTVAALRAVGIPARQCYTPRWAHTDDNHAWVEVWVDGAWHYMGACEPEATLDKAWFSGPAKRAMMVHTNVFGKYNGKESKTEFPLYTKINVLENYTDTKRFDVTVIGENGAPVSDASVKFKVYNYAEYYTIYEQKTGKDGKAYVISGLGDLLIMASKEDKFGFRKVSLTKENNAIIKLNCSPGKEYEEDLDITPPVNKAVFTNDTSAKTKENNVRLKYEDSLRNAYLATFMTQEEAIKLADSLKLNKEEVAKYIVKSEGNFKEIIAFIIKNAANPDVLNILSTVTDKDLRDTPADILQSHLNHSKNNSHLSKEIYVEGVLSPRISLELISNWRPYLQQKFQSVFTSKATGEEVKNWITQNIKVVDGENYSGCILSPMGVEKIRRADKVSRNVFFVALCRSFNIPAKIDMATSDIKLYKNGDWESVSLDPAVPAKPNGNIIINYKSEDDIIPQYLSYYSLAKYDNGDFIQLDYEDDARVANFPVNLNLEEGYYRLTTGNRYPDGKVLAHNTYLNIKKDKEINTSLNIRQLSVEKKIYGKVPASIEKSWYEKGMVICFLEPDREPTKHIMNDIPIFRNKFNEWGGKFVFVVPESNLTNNFSASQFNNLPGKSVFVTKNGNQIMNTFLKSANQAFRGNYPLLYLVNKNGEIIFYSEGYRIGMGDVLWKAMKMAE